MKKLTTLFAGSLFLMGCTENNIVVKNSDLSNHVWVCNTKYLNTDIRAVEILHFYESDNSKNDYMMTSFFYPKDKKELQFKTNQVGKIEIKGNKLFYFVEFIEQDNDPITLLQVSVQKPQLIEIIREKYADYQGQPSKADQIKPIVANITEFKPDEFKFTQKISNEYRVEGRCIAEEKAKKTNAEKQKSK